MRGTSSDLRVEGLCKRYGSVVALAPTDLEVGKGEFLTLLGPSGSGKTTLLSLVAGLSTPDAGRVFVNARDITHSPPYERDIGVVFQNYALFPHMTVAENIAFPLRMRRLPAAEIDRRVAGMLETVHLAHTAARLPRELSGGQQQRIALARCLVYQPSIVLMDEPLGALDRKLRDSMQLEIKRIHRETGTTIVYVTHDQEEAMTMSDRICVMNSGRVEQLGAPGELYFHPRTLFVADFLGESNLLHGTVTSREEGTVRVRLDVGLVTSAHAGEHGFDVGGRAIVMVRPQHLSVAGQGAMPDCVSGRVRDVMVSGSLTKVYVDTSDGKASVVAAYPTRHSAPTVAFGDVVSLRWHDADAVALPE